jgi:sterol desaturase/sphingolipid hydroxylase (fatty acid hydroxylase superfamily)
MKRHTPLQDWIATHPSAVSIATLAIPAAILVTAAVEAGPSIFSAHFATGTANFLDYFHVSFISTSFVVFFAVILVLERLIPADPTQASLTRGLLFDTGFCVISLLIHFLLVALFAVLFLNFFSRHVPLSGLPIKHWPNWLRVLIVLVSIDFAGWLSHVIRHKIPMLWHFHALHHSQGAMNLMTEFRMHPCDLLARTLIVSFVFIVVQIPIGQALIFVLLQKYYLMFLHANVDITYGPLDRIFVSPRVHRLHHAIQPELHDRNYGVYLSIWDTVFGSFQTTAARTIKTGVEGFPDERDVPWYRLPLTFLRQITLPLSQTGQSLRAMLKARSRSGPGPAI